jgi:acyl carrier protein
MSEESVDTRIKGFLLERFPLARTRGLAENDQLLENGILDSLGVLDLVAYLEREFAIGIEDDDLQPDHFATVQSLTAFVAHKRGRSG